MMSGSAFIEMRMSSPILSRALLLIGALLSSTPWAQSSPEQDPGQPSFDLLWSIKGEKNRVYLLGSVHLLPHGARALPDVVNAAYRTSDLLVFESDLFLIGSVDFEQDELAQARYPAGKTIADEISAGLMNQAQNKAEDLGLPLRILERYRPWFFAQALATAQFSRDGFPLDNGVDVRLYRQAVTDMKLTTGLTPPEEHLATFADLDVEQSEHFLASTLKDLNDTGKHVAKILKIYQDADLALLGQLVEEMKRDDGPLYERFIAARNRNWLAQFEDLRQRDSNVLVIVDAMHLVGDQGLVELFRQRGWEPSVPKYRGFRPPE